MSTDITKKFITADSRFDLAEKVLRSLLPGAVLVAKYPDDAPRTPSQRIFELGSKDAVELRGELTDEAVPSSVELTFMPPPGLDFDSRHILFGLFETAEVVDTARVAAWNAFIDEIDAYNASPATGALPDSVIAVEMAIRAARDAASARSEYLIAKAGGDAEAIAAAPSAADVVELEEAAARLRIRALSALRTEEATLLAPLAVERTPTRGNVATPC